MNQTLNDLHNPQNITDIFLKSGKHIGKDDDQQWQEWPGSMELWQLLSGGRLYRVQRWLKKSITHVLINDAWVAI